MLTLRNLLAALAATSLISSASAKACPPLGAVLPPPKSPSKSKDVQAAVSGVVAALESTLKASSNASGVSVAVKSIYEDELLLNYHYTPPDLSGIGTDTIDEDTIYRVGSLSKVMPALAALQAASVNMDDSVLKYLPGLASGPVDPIKSTPWSEVTVGSIMSHLAGIATDTAYDLALFPQVPWTDMGLPEVPKGTGPTCSGLPGTTPCTKEQLIDEMHRRAPVYLPYSTPVYSNIGFAIIALVVEAATGKDFYALAEKNIWNVAGMKSTSFNGPVKSFSKDGFVPIGETTWNLTLGVFEPAGGMFSNTVDIIAFGEAILQNRLLSAEETRRWMKPTTHTSALGFSVGAPWEIFRGANLTADGRVVDVYSKSGDLGSYHSIMGLVADYGIVVSVLTGGPEVSANPYSRDFIFSTVVEALVPAVEAAGHDAAAAAGGFVGKYADEASNSSVALTLDDGPGLLITEFNVRGYDVLNNMPLYALGGAPAPHVEGRMYPTDITYSGDACSNDTTTQMSWRAYYDTETEAQKEAIDSGIFTIDASCDSWFTLDRNTYNLLSLAEFVFLLDADGSVQGVENPAFNVTMTKAST